MRTAAFLEAIDNLVASITLNGNRLDHHDDELTDIRAVFGHDLAAIRAEVLALRAEVAALGGDPERGRQIIAEKTEIFDGQPATRTVPRRTITDGQLSSSFETDYRAPES